MFAFDHLCMSKTTYKIVAYLQGLSHSIDLFLCYHDGSHPSIYTHLQGLQKYLVWYVNLSDHFIQTSIYIVRCVVFIN